MMGVGELRMWREEWLTTRQVAGLREHQLPEEVFPMLGALVLPGAGRR